MVGEAVVAELELEGQPGVIDAETVQHGGVQIVGVHGVAHGVGAGVVRLAKGQARTNADAGRPQGEAARMKRKAEIGTVEDWRGRPPARKRSLPEDGVAKASFWQRGRKTRM